MFDNEVLPHLVPDGALNNLSQLIGLVGTSEGRDKGRATCPLWILSFHLFYLSLI